MNQLENLLQQCTVKLSLPGCTGWGTGFFVAPERILTCAHVVQPANGNPIQVQWQKHGLEALVERSLPDPYDLALLRVTLPIGVTPPCVYLDEEVRSRDPLYLFAYPDEGDRHGEPRTFNCDGITGSDVASILFNLGQVRPGMSGSPLLNQRTGKVCGTVKFTRDRSSDLGGGAIPVRIILEQFPELNEFQREFHQQDRRWINILKAIRVESRASINFTLKSICQSMLNRQKRLTSNPMLKLKDIYIPLDFEERQKSNLASSLKEQGILSVPEQIVTTISHQQFFEEILRQGRSSNSNGQRLAVVGEAGTGKTTLLQEIAQWILDNDLGLPIWISLGLLNNYSLSSYLQDWLRDAELNPTPEIWSDLKRHIQKGKVWLLIDGLDELSNPLEPRFLESLQNGWVTKTRIVLSSRTNTWEISRDRLSVFDTYYISDFSPIQTKQFVYSWFKRTQDISGGRKLWLTLTEPKQQYLRDLVRNPLRCSLLCIVWQRRGRSLPSTQAELYREYIEFMYDWKSPKPNLISSEIRRKLSEALGNLALKAIDYDKSRLLISQDLVREIFEEIDTPLFQLALRLNFLRHIGFDLSHRPVYMFENYTFQEYFAALAIEDWKFFVHHIRSNPNNPKASYRIFESKWYRVFLLWLGRVEVTHVQKETLIKSLIQFRDSCGGYYRSRAYILAISGVSEFRECLFADQIIIPIIRLFTLQFRLQDLWLLTIIGSRPISPDSFEEDEFSSLIKATVGKTDPHKVIQPLIRLLQTENPSKKSLFRFLSFTQERRKELDYLIFRVALDILGTVGKDNITVIKFLSGFLQSETIQNSELRLWTAINLGKIDPTNKLSIQVLSESLNSETDCRLAARKLLQINPDNKIALHKLTEILSNDSFFYLEPDFSKIKDLVQRNKLFIFELEEKLKTSAKLLINQELSYSKSSYSIDKLVDLSRSLVMISPRNKVAIQTLIKLSTLECNTDQVSDISWQVQLTSQRAVEALGAVGRQNKLAIQALRDLFKSSSSDESRRWIFLNLARIDPKTKLNSQHIINTSQFKSRKIGLKNFIRRIRFSEEERSNENEKAITRNQIYRLSIKMLGEIGQLDKLAIQFLVKALNSTDTLTRDAARESLIKGITKEDCIELASTFRALRENQLLSHCAENLSYLQFYYAFHAFPSLTLRWKWLTNTLIYKCFRKIFSFLVALVSSPAAIVAVTIFFAWLVLIPKKLEFQPIWQLPLLCFRGLLCLITLPIFLVALIILSIWSVFYNQALN